MTVNLQDLDFFMRPDRIIRPRPINIDGSMMEIWRDVCSYICGNIAKKTC